MDQPFPPAVVAQHLTFEVGSVHSSRKLLNDVSFALPQAHFAAIIGSSGCGKSTLLRTLAGLLSPASGSICLLGHSLNQFKTDFPLALGYLPQFSEAHEDLTIQEILEYGAKLQLPDSLDPAMREKWLAYLIKLAGLEELGHQKYRNLSGGQRRRVALAETLMADPPILLVDELTSGLDPKAESSMMEWLRFLAKESGKTILLVTHSVHNLDQTDSVLFMKQGRLRFHGSYEDLRECCPLASMEELYQKEDLTSLDAEMERRNLIDFPKPEPQPIRTAGPASGLRQFLTLVRRQFLLLGRDRAQIILQIALLITFPSLVAVFALDGLPQVRNLSLSLDTTNIIHSLQEQLVYLKDSMSSATLISGLIMFQVILLTLSGSNNGAREIARERSILEKEWRTGLSTLAYVSSKMLFMILLSLVQSFWMTWFVKTICRFPGDFRVQFAILLLTTLAMSTTCLAISARASSSEKASLLAIYLVGLQLPLSGAVLALPSWLVWITRPFIAAYWGWSGYLKSLTDYRLYDIVRQSTHTWLAMPELACGMLITHIVLAFLSCLVFVSRQRAT